jgi:cytoskeletal protein CcmA (bactofilin family)
MSFFTSRRQSEPFPASPEAERQQPPRPPVTSGPIGFETVLGAGSILEGTLKSKANVRLDGTFTGTLEIEGNVLVGETAKITADVNARNVSIAGAVRGNVSGRKVQILRTGRVWGDIEAMALTTEEGAFIDGKITMTGHEAAGGPQSTESAASAEPEAPVDEMTPIEEEAAQRGIDPDDVLDETDMTAEGGMPGEDPRDKNEPTS